MTCLDDLSEYRWHDNHLKTGVLRAPDRACCRPRQANQDSTAVAIEITIMTGSEPYWQEVNHNYREWWVGEFSLLQSLFENAVNWTLWFVYYGCARNLVGDPREMKTTITDFVGVTKRVQLVLVWSVIPCNEAYTSETSFHHYYSLSPRPTLSISDYKDKQ